MADKQTDRQTDRQINRLIDNPVGMGHYRKPMALANKPIDIGISIYRLTIALSPYPGYSVVRALTHSRVNPSWLQ